MGRNVYIYIRLVAKFPVMHPHPQALAVIITCLASYYCKNEWMLSHDSN